MLCVPGGRDFAYILSLQIDSLWLSFFDVSLLQAQNSVRCCSGRTSYTFGVPISCRLGCMVTVTNRKHAATGTTKQTKYAIERRFLAA